MTTATAALTARDTSAWMTAPDSPIDRAKR